MSPIPDAHGARQPGTDELLTQFDRRFRRPLLAFFSRRVLSRAEAEDLTQDVFERVLKGFGDRPILNAEALIFRIALNLLRDRARKVQRHGIEEPIPPDAIGEFADALAVDLSPERVVMGEKALDDVLSVLNSLGERTRAIFYLYRFENLKIREIAQVYGISASAVEKHVGKALLELTRRLQVK